MKKALLWEKKEKQKVKCFLCAHGCLISPGKRGICGVRENREGLLYSLVYGLLIAQNVDPIEKKPLFHVYPGSLSYSIATVGCNFKCSFCQNADISQSVADHNRITGREVSPETVVQSAMAARCKSIAYTYTEPTIFYEYALDVARLAFNESMINVFVSNGYMSSECLDGISPYLAAANVDLKSFRDKYYKEQCKARLQPVLDSLKKMKELGVWVEVTTLLIPGLNDSDEELRDIARFLLELGPETPWHISRFWPTYKLTDVPPTPVRSVQHAREIGLEEGLHFVYTGNLPGDEGEKTYCPVCKTVLIDRAGYTIHGNNIVGGECSACGHKVPGLGV